MSTLRLRIAVGVAALLGNVTELPVHRNLDYALEEGRAPALAVTSGPDQPQPGSPISKLDHEVALEISILVARSSDPEAAADGYEAAIHAALSPATAIDGIPIIFERGPAEWDFEFGDCCKRTLRYIAAFRTDALTLES